MNKQEFVEWIGTVEERYMYMLLSRMQQDCEYYLGYGSRCEERLWAGSVNQQIEFMRILYDSVPGKPEWLSLEDIKQYELAMKV